MRSWSEWLFAVGGALLLQALWRSTPHSFNDLFNFLAIAVVYLALSKGEITGAVVGTICGLAQDSLGLRVFGLAGLTKTILGFSVGLAWRKFDLSAFSRQFMVLFLACSLELVIWSGLALVIFGVHAPFWYGVFWLQPLTTSLTSSFIFHLRHKWLKRQESK